MKKIFILLVPIFLLVSCVEQVAVLGTGVTNGKVVQTSLQSGVSFGVKKATGKTPFGHTLSYVKKNKNLHKKNKNLDKKNPCSSFVNKKELEICLIVEKRIISQHVKLKEKKSLKEPSKEFASSLQLSINEQSKIKYLD
jgi:hypothetical protein